MAFDRSEDKENFNFEKYSMYLVLIVAPRKEIRKEELKIKNGKEERKDGRNIVRSLEEDCLKRTIPFSK